MIEELTIEQYLQIAEGEGILFLGAGAPGIVKVTQQPRTAPRAALGKAVLLISTDSVDRKNHILRSAGMDITNYKNNPVFMWNHAGYSDPMAIIGRTLQIEQHQNHVIASVQYVSTTTSKLPDHLFELEKQGLLPGNSIGARPMGKITRSADGIITIGEWELLDVSKVAVGMDAKATNKLIVP